MSVRKHFILCLGFMCSALVAVSCFGKTVSQENTNSPALSKEVQDPEIEKIDIVLSKMSSRAKSELAITDKEEFLKELHLVLQAEEEINDGDLSPFFLIDKKHSVSAGYKPANLIHLESNQYYKVNKNSLNLKKAAYDALGIMAQAAKKDGVTLTVSSTYRSYEYQKNLFDYWVKVDGLEEAERESARPGTSQHQLGYALDFAPVDDAFADTPEGAWVYKNAADYGWSLSFPKNYEDITGYRWESWHFRYIGKKACTFQKKYFLDVQQYMIEFIDLWKNS